MTIRHFTKDDFEESLALSQFAFQYQLSAEEIDERKQQMKPEHVLGYFVDGELASKLHLFPFEINLHGKRFKMGGVAGVATWPEYRRGGMVGKLIRASLEQMKAQGQTVSMLHPFDFSFYRRFGWEAGIDTKKITLEKHQLPRFKDITGVVRRVKAKDGDTIKLLQPVYEAHAGRYNGTLVRDEEYWQLRVINKCEQLALYYNEEGSAEGYILYDVKDKVMNVGEIIHVNENARKALWTFAANHDSMIEKLEATVPVDDPIAYLLDDPRIKQEVISYFMYRIVDVEAFLKLYPFVTREKHDSLFLHVTDEHAPWNNATFQVAVDEQGKADVSVFSQPADGASCSHPPKRGLIISIQSLAAMLFSIHTPTFLFEAGKIEGNESDVSRWEAIIPKRNTMLYDFF